MKRVAECDHVELVLDHAGHTVATDRPVMTWTADRRKVALPGPDIGAGIIHVERFGGGTVSVL